jgi:uncharacterized repeat protein (TIGR04076 family)
VTDDLLPEAPRLRVVVDRAAAPECGLAVGDSVLIDGPLMSTGGRPFCPLALAAVIPVLAARQYPIPADDWLARKPYLSCPNAVDQVVLRIEACAEEAT